MTAKPALEPCGTNAAYKRHRVNGEDACAACKAAHRTYTRRYAQKARANYPIRDCTVCGQHRPIQRQPQGWCESCTTRWYAAGRPETGPPTLDLETVRAARAAGAAVARQYRDINQAVRNGGWAWAVTP